MRKRRFWFIVMQEMRAKDLLDRKIIKIYEGLNQQIKENNESVDDVKL